MPWNNQGNNQGNDNQKPGGPWGNSPNGSGRDPRNQKPDFDDFFRKGRDNFNR